MDPAHLPGDPFLLFVYGTLKRGGVRHGALRHQRYLRDVCTRPLYALYDLGFYPGLIRGGEKGQTIHGELYEVVAALRPWLDRVESAPDLFRLEPVELADNAGPVFSYFYQQSVEGCVWCQDGLWNNP